MNLTPADLSRYAAAMNKTLLDTATNGRTHATLPCRIDAGSGTTRLGGLSSIEAQIPNWIIYFQRDVDVKAGDSISVTGRGSFVVVEVSDPRTIDTALEAKCVGTARADGSWPVPTNAIVTFRKAGDSSQTIPSAHVLIEPNFKTPWINSLVAQYEYVVMWQTEALKYGDGSLITLGDEIVWDFLDSPGFATLALPSRDVLLGVSTAYFNSIGQSGQGI